MSPVHFFHIECQFLCLWFTLVTFPLFTFLFRKFPLPIEFHPDRYWSRTCCINTHFLFASNMFDIFCFTNTHLLSHLKTFIYSIAPTFYLTRRLFFHNVPTTCFTNIYFSPHPTITLHTLHHPTYFIISTAPRLPPDSRQLPILPTIPLILDSVGRRQVAEVQPTVQLVSRQRGVGRHSAHWRPHRQTPDSLRRTCIKSRRFSAGGEMLHSHSDIINNRRAV